MKPKRILMAESSDIYHDYRVQKEAGSLAEAGYAVTVYGFRQGARPGDTFAFSLHTLPVVSRKRRFWRNASMLWNIGLINLALLCRRAEFYHAHNTMFLVGMWASARMHGGRFVYDAHEVQWELGRLPARLEAAFIRRADAIIAVAPGRARAMAERYGVPPERIGIVSNYPVFDGSRVTPPATAGSAPVRLIFSGGFNLNNNRLDVLLQAMRAVPEVDLTLMAFGYGDGEAVLNGIVRDCGLEERVRFVPLVKPHEVMGAIRGYDAAVNLLINPGHEVAIRFPSVNKMYEYLAAGLPILCSNIEGFDEEFVREGAAISVDADDVESVAHGLRDLAGDRERLARMKGRALELARDRYNWRSQAERLRQVYRRLETPGSADPC